MNPEQIALIQGQGISLLIKISFTVVLVFIEIFLLIVHKQIHSMNRIVTQPDMFPYLQIFTFFLEIIVIILLVLTFVVI